MVVSGADPPRGFDRCVEAALLEHRRRGAACNSLRFPVTRRARKVRRPPFAYAQGEPPPHLRSTTSRKIHTATVASRHERARGSWRLLREHPQGQNEQL